LISYSSVRGRFTSVVATPPDSCNTVSSSTVNYGASSGNEIVLKQNFFLIKTFFFKATLSVTLSSTNNAGCANTSNNLSAGAVAGIVIGVVAAVALAVFLVFLIFSKRRDKKVKDFFGKVEKNNDIALQPNNSFQPQ
jgi:hypothetical protein